MRVLFALVVAGVLSIITSSAFAETGMISKKSAHSVSDTIDRLERILTEKGLTIFAKIDHSAGAKKAGLDLLPTTLLIFGNPKLGTPLMKASATTALAA